MTEEQVITIEERNKNRRMLVIIFLAFLSPIIIAYALYKLVDWSDDVSRSKGTLVHPARPVSNINFNAMDASEVRIESFQRKWLLIYLDPAGCDETCVKRAENMRITRLTLGESSNRIQNAIILRKKPDPVLLDKLQTEYAKLKLLTVSQEQLNKMKPIFNQSESDSFETKKRFYLLDPNGNLMMYYEDHGDPKWMLIDLRKLMKASQIG